MIVPARWSYILAPQGIKTVTTGGDEIAAFLAAQYGAIDPDEVARVWREALDRVATARVIIVGVPMDCGAGFERGAFKGPLGIRRALLAAPGVRAQLAACGVVDIGDVRVNPHLLADADLSASALAAVRRARGYPAASDWPVAPHDILQSVLEDIHLINPDARVLILGGDHSLSYVPVAALESRSPGALGILHFDAHTDLLEERDGTRYDFATWAHHANRAIGGGQRLQQVGIRVSGHARGHWEQRRGVVQHWADEVRARSPEAVAADIVDSLRRAGVTRLYVSNDIDGTDPRWAAATGTAEPNGLRPSDVEVILGTVTAAIECVGADLVEVAPTLKWHVPGEPRRTLQTAARYALLQIDALLGGGSDLAAALPFPAPAEPGAVAATPAWV
ncbi:MAG: arginase family protein [Myxococcales bacterium]|nr:arginase family protein [Myxococcales bacterium]